MSNPFRDGDGAALRNNLPVDVHLTLSETDNAGHSHTVMCNSRNETLLVFFVFNFCDHIGPAWMRAVS